MKKILVINTKYQITGGEDSNIVDELKFLEKHYDVEYLEFDNSKRIDIFDLFSFITNSNMKSNKKLKAHLREFKPDLVYIHNTWFKASLGIFNILEKQGIQTAIKLHNLRYYCAKSYLIGKHIKKGEVCSACNLDRKKIKVLNKYFNDSLLKSLVLIKYTKKFIKILKKKKFTILTITDFHQQFLLDLGIEEEKINLYSNPIEIRAKNKVRDISKNEYILYAGRLSEEKGVEELLESWKKSDTKGLKLKIIGTGPLEDRLINSFQNPDIIFTGYLNNEAVLEEIKNSRAVVTATKMYEGQPRLLCEASSLGVPSIYPSFGGMNEFFPEDYNFSFKQYDYESLVEKLSAIINTDSIEVEGERVLNFILAKLNESKLIQDFQKAVEE